MGAYADEPDNKSMSQVNNAVMRFLYSRNASTDLDFDYLRRHAKAFFEEGHGFKYVFAQLTRLALSRPLAEDDNNIKTRHLRYMRWLAQGRNVEK